MKIPNENDSNNLKIPQVVWNHISYIFDENTGRFQKELSVQIIENIHKVCGQALEEYAKKKK